MKLPLSALLLAPAAVMLSIPSAAQQKRDPIATVAGHMQSVRTMTASFTQTDRNGQVLAGTLLLKRPGHVRFEYQKNVPLLIVADGKALTMIDYGVKQVQRWPIRNSPLAALLDPGQDLTQFGVLVPSASDETISVQVRDKKRPEFGMMTLVFVKQPSAPGGYTLNGWVALDAKNNRTTIRLTNVKYNGVIADSRFRWTDPRPARRK
jgi:outer membrane lipoprotein-sorting protein